MSHHTLKQKSKPLDFQKDYDKIIKKATEFDKFQYPSHVINYSVDINFKKFSLYKDSSNSITSFNTNATL
jgi:hypothetical protein